MKGGYLIFNPIIIIFLVHSSSSSVILLPNNNGTHPSENLFFSYYSNNFDRVHTRCANPGDFALTFDDGPTSYSEGVLDVLAHENVKATFFVNGNKDGFSSNDSTTHRRLKRIYDEGHEIGSHTWSHTNLVDDITVEEIYKEMLSLEDKVKEITGHKMTIMRPPFGYLNKTVADIIVKELNYSIILWNLESNDWLFKEKTAASMTYYIRALENASNLRSSFISLHHDTLVESEQLARQATKYIKRKGYRLVTISECVQPNKTKP